MAAFAPAHNSAAAPTQVQIRTQSLTQTSFARHFSEAGISGPRAKAFSGARWTAGMLRTRQEQASADFPTKTQLGANLVENADAFAR